MRKLKCIIIDDEEMAVKVLESHIAQIEDLEVSGIYYSGVEAFLELEQMDVDVLFLDIEMPKITGLSMLQMLKNPPLTVLTTAHRDYALDGFELDVLDYLLKPISFERFLKTITKIKRLHTTPNPMPTPKAPLPKKDHVFIKVDRQYVKLYFKDIQYVEALKNHVRIVTPQRSYISLINISSFENELPGMPFVRVHRSYIINVHHLNSFNTQQVDIGQCTIPIGRSYKDGVKKVLNAV